MPIEHVIFIPGTLLIGMAFGYMMGARAAREEERKRREAKKR